MSAGRFALAAALAMLLSACGGSDEPIDAPPPALSASQPGCTVQPNGSCR